jgi:hypothetical protein
VSDVTYRMLAADAGVKWRRLAVNSQYFFRWLNNFASHRLDLRPRLRDDGEPGYRSEEVGIVWPHLVRLWPFPQFL